MARTDVLAIQSTVYPSRVPALLHSTIDASADNQIKSNQIWISRAHLMSLMR